MTNKNKFTCLEDGCSKEAIKNSNYCQDHQISDNGGFNNIEKELTRGTIKLLQAEGRMENKEQIINDLRQSIIKLVEQATMTGGLMYIQGYYDYNNKTKDEFLATILKEYQEAEEKMKLSVKKVEETIRKLEEI